MYFQELPSNEYFCKSGKDVKHIFGFIARVRLLFRDLKGLGEDWLANQVLKGGPGLPFFLFWREEEQAGLIITNTGSGI